MGRPAVLLVALAAAAAVVVAATTTATVIPAGGAPPPSAAAAVIAPPAADFASPPDVIADAVAAAAAFADAVAATAVTVDPAATARTATRPFRRRLSRAAADPITCLTLGEFKADTAETARRMKADGVPAEDIAAFERTLLGGYEAYVVRAEGNCFCVRRDAFADWIVDVFLAALDGKLRT